jgi:hypothetical protein
LSSHELQPNSFRFSNLFADLIDGLVSAQKSLDQFAIEQRDQLFLVPQGALAVPPLWFHFRQVKFDLELQALAVEAQGGPSLTCRLIDSVTSNLMETDTSIRSRISVTIEPITKLSDANRGKLIVE